jgi:thiazole/oxazole-forming peptide maturase SagD family component
MYDVSNHVNVIWTILEQCNGYQSARLIFKKVLKSFPELDRPLVNAVLDDLRGLGVIVDSRECYRHFHDLTNYPARYNRKLSSSEVIAHTSSSRLPVKAGEETVLMLPETDLMGLLGTRKSCRAFSVETLSREQLSYILSAGYSIKSHATPSAGGLYPLKVYLIVTRDHGYIDLGYYEYDAERDRIVKYSDLIDRPLLQYAFNSGTLLFNAPIIVVIAADLSRQSFKYVNRGYRFSVIEAGQTAQNMLLAATDCSVGSLECGSFLDSVLADELSINDASVVPIIAVAFGIAEEKPDKNTSSSETLSILESELVGPSKPIRRYDIIKGMNPQKGETFFAASAQYKPSPHQNARGSYRERFSGGTATSADMAQVKAISEAYERYVSGLVHCDVEAKACQLAEPWIDPRVIAPFSKQQLIQQPQLQAFGPNKRWQWVYGNKLLSGSRVLVPVDLVYYPLPFEVFGRKPCYEASSSGVASYSTELEAVNKGLLELIERDCIMRNWFCRQSPQKIAYDILPYHWQRRIDYWQGKQRRVYIVDISRYGVVAVGVIITSKESPCFVIGAAASDMSFEEALSKAFQEAELQLLVSVETKRRPKIIPENVMTPEDHGKLYAQTDYLDYLEWLWQGEITFTEPKPESKFQNLVKLLDPVVVQLSPSSSTLKVVRVLSDKLVPINFGFGTEHFLHYTIKRRELNLLSLKLPHYFA